MWMIPTTTRCGSRKDGSRLSGSPCDSAASNALTLWASVITNGGFAVVSELSWLRDQAPDAVREFFASSYPDMQSIQQNIAVAEDAGYRALTTYTLPNDVWATGYYGLLEPRAQTLLDHPDESVRNFAAETMQEIAIFNASEDSYGYIFYVHRRT